MLSAVVGPGGTKTACRRSALPAGVACQRNRLRMLQGVSDVKVGMQRRVVSEPMCLIPGYELHCTAQCPLAGVGNRDRRLGPGIVLLEAQNRPLRIACPQSPFPFFRGIF